jgi:hypothetical protein
VCQPGHRIQLEIKSMDTAPHQEEFWTGKIADTGPIPGARTMHCQIRRDARYCSHIQMPLIESTPREAWLQPLA